MENTCVFKNNSIGVQKKSKKRIKKKKKKSVYRFNIVDGILFMIATLLIILISGIVMLYGKINNKTAYEIKSNLCKSSNYEIIDDIDMSKDSFGTLHLKGTLKNISNRNINSCHIEYNLYDKDNNKIGTAIASKENLKKNAFWEFEANCMNINGKLSKYEISKVSLD